MTFEADLEAFLLADAAIAAALADEAANETRLYPGRRPAKQKNLPAMTYGIISGSPGEAANLDGDDSDAAGGLEDVRLQVDVWAKDADAARVLARLVIARMAVSSTTIRSMRLGRSSSTDPDTHEAREVLDFSVWHTPQ